MMMFNETCYNFYPDFDGLGDTGKIVGIGTSTAGSLIPLLSASAIAGPIGLVVGLVGGLIASIFGRHAAKVRREDEVTGVWAETGQVAITETMALWRAGKASSAEAIAGLKSIQEQFKTLMSPVVKTNGKFGQWPDLNAPRPSNKCNAACGLYYELNDQVKKLIAEIQAGPDPAAAAAKGPAAGAASLFGGASGAGGNSMLPLLLIGGAALLLFS